MKQFLIHISKIRTQFKAFFYFDNTKHPCLSKIHPHILFFLIVVVFQCNSKVSVITHYIFFYIKTKILKYADEVLICCIMTTRHAFRFMNIDINILSVQGLLFDSVISYAEHKDEKDT